MSAATIDFGYCETVVEVCFTDAHIAAALRKHGAADDLADDPGVAAWVTTYAGAPNMLLFVVHADRVRDLAPLQIAALMTHEAVHVMQNLREWMREQDPGWEWEAYTVQYVAQRAMEAWAKLAARRPKRQRLG